MLHIPLSRTYQRVYSRVLSRWENSQDENIIEIVDDCFHHLKQNVNEYLEQPKPSPSQAEAVLILNDLSEKKRQLEQLSWNPAEKSPEILKVFSGDLYFYACLAAMLNYGLIMLESIIPASQLPSFHSSRIRIDYPRFKEMVLTVCPVPPEWMNLYLPEQEISRIEESLEILNRKGANPDPNDCMWHIFQSMKEGSRSVVIETLEEEQYLEQILDELALKANRPFTPGLGFSILVDAIQTGLLMIHQVTGMARLILESPGEGESLTSPFFVNKFIAGRIKKIKNDKWKVPRRWKARIMEDFEIVQILAEEIVKRKKHLAVEPKMLVWKASSRELVQCLVPVLKKGWIALEGNASFNSLLNRLIEYVRVEKIKGEGYVANDSLVTYLKREVREE
jgi:hypothetical protein